MGKCDFDWSLVLSDLNGRVSSRLLLLQAMIYVYPKKFSPASEYKKIYDKYLKPVVGNNRLVDLGL